MKILQINASYKPAFVYGGPTISVSTLCEQLVKGGEHVEVITTTANGKDDLQFENGDQTIIEGVPVSYFKRITGDHSHFSPGLLKYLLKRINKQDIVHIHAWWNLVSVGAATICFFKGKSYVFSPRGTLSTYSFLTSSASL